MRVWIFQISAGRLFHSFGEADWKARSLTVGRHRALAGTNTVAFLDLRYLDWEATTIRSTRYYWIVFVSRWCCKSGPLKAIGQLSHDGIGWNIRVKFVISHWSVLIRLFPVKLAGLRSVYCMLVKFGRSIRSPFVGFVFVVDKSFVRRR